MARNRIAGITIEIGGDTTPLQKALGGVNKSLGATQSNLKDVNKLLKLDPKNTNLLKQKQEYLAKAIDDTKEKLDKEKQVLAELKKKSTTDDVTEEQKALEREIAETEESLKDLTKQYKKFGSVSGQQLQEVGKDLKNIGGKMTKAGKTMTTKVTGPIVAGFTAAVKTTADFDAQMSKVNAISGASADQMKTLRDKAREMGAKTKFSATEAGEAFEYMAMAGWKTDDMLEGIEGIMNLAAASGEDLATTSDIVTDALTAFGLSAKDSGHFADVLAAASTNANTNVSMLGESFKYAAPVAGSLGISAEDTSVALGLMANAGIKASQAGTALRTGLTNLAKPSKQMREAMDEYNISLVTNKDGSVDLQATMEDLRTKMGGMSETEQAAAAAAIFGKNAMAGWLAVVNASDEDFDKLTGAIANCDGTAESMATTMQDNLSGQITILMSQLQELAISIGEIVMPYVRSFVEKLQSMVDWFNNLNPAAKETAVKIAALAAAIGPLLIAGGKVTSGIGTVIGWAGKLKGAIGVAGGASGLIGGIGGLITAAGPILAGGAVVAGLVAGGVLIYKNWDKIKAGAKKVAEVVSTKWDELKTNVTAAAQKVHDDVKDKFEKVRDKATTAFETLRANATAKFEAARDAVVSAVGTLHDTATEKFEAAKTALTNAAETIRRNVSEKFEEAKTKAATAIDKLKSEASDKFDTAKTNLTNAAENIRRTVADKFEEAKTKAATAVEKLKNETTNKFETAKTNITTKAGNIFDTVKSKFEDAKDKATTAFETLKNNVKSNLGDAATNAENGGKTVYNAISTKFEEARKIAAQKIADIVKPDDIKFKNMKTRIHNAMGPVIAKVKDRFEQVRKKAAEKVDAIKDKFNNIKLTLPKPKLPRISLDWGYVDVFGKEMKYPKGFKVSWNRRAYENPLMFTRPTVLATPYGLQGFGDGPGGEIVLGERKLREIVGAAGDTNYYITVNGAAGQNVNELADAVQRRLIALQNQRRAAGLA